VVLVPPFLLSLSAKEAFRLPKLMASEGLALASLLFLAWQVRKVDEVRLADLRRRPAVLALAPLLLVVTLGLWTTDHPLHVREGLIDLWIGAAALAGWSLALPARRLRALLGGLLLPATALGLIGILQFHGVFQPLPLISVAHDQRLSLTSTAGNPGDLGVYLVLPCLIAEWILIGGAAGRARWLPAWLAGWFPLAALAVCLYAMALTQTLAALAALAVSSLLLWTSVLPRRRVALLLGGGAALVLVLVLAVAPLRARVAGKVGQALQGDWNSVLTGRLDGWRAAVWMLRENPWTGVGQGAFRPAFIPAKLALLDRGAPFYAGQLTPVFANAHNEYLEAAADWGIPGILALAWALWTLGAALRHRGAGEDQGLAVAGVAALAILSLAHFPFRIALVGYPALLFLAWVLRPREAGEEREAAS
jgi:O-antigen ligase